MKENEKLLILPIEGFPHIILDTKGLMTGAIYALCDLMSFGGRCGVFKEAVGVKGENILYYTTKPGEFISGCANCKYHKNNCLRHGS